MFRFSCLFAALALVAGVGCQTVSRVDAGGLLPGNSADGLEMTVVSYNIRVGHGGARERQPERTEEYLTTIAEWIKEIDADVVLLQEVDDNAPRSQRIDQARFLAEKTGLGSYYTPALHLDDGWRYGNAILSRWPMKKVEGHMLFKPDYSETNPDYPRGYEEQRALQVVELDTPAGPVHVLNTHLGLTQTQRIVQLEEIAGKIEALPEGAAIFFGGDLNARPETPEIEPVRALLADSFEETPNPLKPEEMLTSSTINPRATIDYLFFSPGRISILDVHVPREVDYSDHLPVVGRYVVHPAQ